jgi:DNA polymerase III delta prime subunit
MILRRVPKKLFHAYFFSGPKYTGKLETALAWAERLSDFRKNESGENTSLNFRGLGRGFGEDKITAESAREATKWLGLSSSEEEGRRVLVIDGVDKMTREAANSLLKVVEEPSDKALVIMTSSFESRVIPALLSRCQKVVFDLEKEEAIKNYLEERCPNKDQLLIEKCANIARGRRILAEKFLLDEGRLQETEDMVEKFRLALRGGLVAGFEFAEKIEKDKEEQIIDQWIDYLFFFLKGLVAKNESPAVIKKVKVICYQLLTLKKDIKNSNLNVRLQVENFFVQL